MKSARKALEDEFGDDLDEAIEYFSNCIAESY